MVFKADGLAAGKGVYVAATHEQAAAAVDEIMVQKKFGESGGRVIVEDCLVGEEVSVHVICAGEKGFVLPSSQDHKRIFEGDEGPNTGGMGAYSPAPVVTPEMHERIMDQVIRPTVAGMAQENMPYTGFLYAGVMIDDAGIPKVLEYNCRFGDPETQPIMLRMKSDLVAHCLAALDGKLDQEQTEWDPRAALGVVLAAGGYPGSYRQGDEIHGLPDESEGQKVFHAGTAEKEGKVVTAGGRVLCATALGQNVTRAQQQAYQLVAQISWDGMYFRKDIGHKAVSRENS